MTKETKSTELSLYRDRSFHQDDWHLLAEGEDFSDFEKPILPFALAMALFEAGSNLPEALGVLLAPGDDVEALVPHLANIALVAIDFPAFADGRGFSSARLLKERHKYQGEVRAIGQYILDQMPFLERCGVDSFLITSAKIRAGLERGEWPEVTNYYQPTGQDTDPPFASRTWLRQKRK